MGISPGVTNFLIGERVMPCMDSLVCNDVSVQSVDLYLLENIRAKQIIFSWSPQVAFDELEQKPRFYEKEKLKTVEPFSHSRTYQFPHSGQIVEQYPLYQEEILSLHQTFPEIDTIRAFTGGSEVELVKSLYQLNLLSKEDPRNQGMTIEETVRAALPQLQTPKQVEELHRKGIIESAQFAAMAEIILQRRYASNKKWHTTTEITGLSFHRYHELLNTPYRGATYISYPTGIGAAVLLFYSYQSWLKNKKPMTGIIRGEELPGKMLSTFASMAKLELAQYKIDLISHIHAA